MANENRMYWIKYENNYFEFIINLIQSLSQLNFNLFWQNILRLF